MALLEGLNINNPLLQASLGLLQAGEQGKGTGFGLGQGLLGFTQGRAQDKEAEERKRQTDILKTIQDAQLASTEAGTAKTIAETGQIGLPQAPDLTSIQQNLIAAGLQPGTPEFQAKLLELISRPIGTSITVGDPSVKGQIDALNLQLKDLNIQQKKRKLGEFTEGQNNSAQFATIMQQAEGNIEKVIATGFDPTTIQEAAIAAAPIGSNLLRSNESQLHRQAQEAWVRAKLRKESGAVIAKDEMEQEIKTFFPQTGDGPDVIAQKKKARETATNSLISAAGGAFKDQQPSVTAPSGLGSVSDEDLLKMLQ